MKRKRAGENVSAREKSAASKGRTYAPRTKWGKALLRKVDLVVLKVDANAVKAESALQLAMTCKERLDVNDRATGELVSGWGSGWLSGCLAGWLPCWLAGWPVHWYHGWLPGWLPGWLAGGKVMGGDGEEGGSREAVGIGPGGLGWGGEWSLVVDSGWGSRWGICGGGASEHCLSIVVKRPKTSVFSLVNYW